MSEKDHLFALIHSLKNTEKSYFKKIKAAFGNSDSSLIQLFDAIQKVDKYDEETISKSLGKDSYREFISAKKYVLFNEILDILNYMKSKTEEGVWQINRLVGHALILKEKMLYEEALKTLGKAQKIAIENDFFSKQLEINQQCIEVLHQQSAMLEQMKKMYEDDNDPFLILNYVVSGGLYYAMNSDMEGYRSFHQKLDEGFSVLIDKTNFSKELMDVKHQQFCYHFE